MINYRSIPRKEIQDTVEYHFQMSALLQAHTTFRLLNNPGGAAGPQTFSIADKGEDLDVIRSDLTLAQNTMQHTTPSGDTPLTDHLNSIRDMLMAQAHELRQEGKKVALIIATDGLPTNEMGIGGFEEQERFIQAMRSLEGCKEQSLMFEVAVGHCPLVDCFVRNGNDI